MRDLIISAVAVVLLISIWLIFFSYSESQIVSFTDTVENRLIPMAEAGDWDSCASAAKDLNTRWEQYKKSAFLFLNTDDLSDIDCSLAKTIKYIDAHDLSNSSGELMTLHRQLSYLSLNEKINAANVL